VSETIQELAVSDPVAIFWEFLIGTWLVIAVISGVSAILGRWIAALTHSVLVVANDSHTMAELSLPSPGRLMAAFKLLSSRSDHLEETSLAKAQFLTQQIDCGKFEKEAVAIFLAGWVSSEFNKISSATERMQSLAQLVKAFRSQARGIGGKSESLLQNPKLPPHTEVPPEVA
jgi:hypothetical protein